MVAPPGYLIEITGRKFFDFVDDRGPFYGQIINFLPVICHGVDSAPAGGLEREDLALVNSCRF